MDYIKVLLLAFPTKMVLSKKHLISMVLINVLLLNCGCVNARPNLETNLIDSNDKNNVRKARKQESVSDECKLLMKFSPDLVSITITFT